MVGVVPVAALVLLAGSLPGYAEPCGDLRPADAQADGVVDEQGQFRFRLLLRDAHTLDALQHLRGGHAGNSLRKAWRFHRRHSVLPVRLRLLPFGARLTLRPGHVTRLPARCGQHTLSERIPSPSHPSRQNPAM